MDKPLICTLNLKESVNAELEKSNFSIYRGSIGTQTAVENTGHYDYKLLLPKFNFPKNIHEYDIFIVDLTNDEIVTYYKSDHERTINKSGSNLFLLSRHPQTVFDSRPYCLSLLKGDLNPNRKILIIVFCAAFEELEYTHAEKTYNSYNSTSVLSFSNYCFLDDIPYLGNKTGFETTISDELNGDLEAFLERHNSNFKYHTTFSHPKKIIDNKFVEDPNFFPLIKNNSDEIVAFFQERRNMGLFFFPDIDEKEKFLADFLQEIAPIAYPDFFPNSEKSKWINEDIYYLPNHKKLLSEKTELEEEFKKNKILKETEIINNNKEYNYLHDLLTKTDSELVNAVIVFLDWLGFRNIVDMDQHDSKKNEDIQIEFGEGLLIIEVKGLGGTSKDSDCSQIDKHKHRREKERKFFDVFALYIVNHQRHLPPISRKNPPFTSSQIEDALHDERGLTTTWDLFNLYFNVEGGVISKEDARNAFLDFGVLNFYKSLISLGKPKEILKKGEVFIIDVNGAELHVGDLIFIKDNERYNPTKILSIQINNQNVQMASNSEVGIKVSLIIGKQSEIFVK